MTDKMDLVGKRFGRYIVLHETDPYVNPKGHKIRRWLCRCDCGKVKKVVQGKLTTGMTLSCGCLGRERRASSIKKHGMAHTRLYHIYRSMVSRCYRKNDISYQSYGKRGIIVCDEWLGENGFNQFRSWALTSGYNDALSIDRIDSDCNYCPKNCRWIPLKDQQNNKRSNHLIEIDGVTKTLTQWANDYGIGYTTIQARLKRGWNDKDAVTIPVDKKYSYKRNCPTFEDYKRSK